MSHSQLRKLLNRNAVILALHCLADDKGLHCYATNKQLGDLANRSTALVATTLHDLERSGEIVRFDWREGVNGRVYILMTHPDGKSYAKKFRQYLQDEARSLGDRRMDSQ